MKVCTILGTRPQFVKAAVVSRAIRLHNASGAGCQIAEEIIHTGQHYDGNMSEVFFEELGLPRPAINLAVGSGSHGDSTGKMLAGIEHEILWRKPDWVLVYGDTNSTLAGALAAVKLHVRVAHVEAGLRSFNRRMPEEINRVVTDHVSDLLFCPTRTAVENLRHEGIRQGVHHVGDVMYDVALLFAQIVNQRSTLLAELGLKGVRYYLATVHRAENTDNPERLRNIMTALGHLAENAPVLFPVHPRTQRRLVELGLTPPGSLPLEHCPSSCAQGALLFMPPVSFLDMTVLVKNASAILTDSGGVQKEAYFHGVPCVTMRDETEWVETVTQGWNQLTGSNTKAILAAVARARRGEPIADFGTGDSASRVVQLLLSNA